jgi:hypothetical protein
LDKLTPIVLFVYNRPEHTKQTVEHLANNKFASSSHLFVFSDGAKNEEDEQKVKTVRNYVEKIKGFRSVENIKREKNFGLANSVIKGVHEILNFYDRVIVLEDDVITAPSFLQFMNRALEYYQKNKNIFSVSGYPYPIKIPDSYEKDVFISFRASSWGWGTWINRWQKVDWDVKDYKDFVNDNQAKTLFNRAGQDLTPMLKAQIRGEIDSWAIRWGYAHIKHNAYCLYPVSPLCRNIGTDRSGTHSSSSKKLDVSLDMEIQEIMMADNLKINEEINIEIQKLFRPSPLRRAINFIKYQLKT